VRLYVDTMDATLVQFDENGRVRFEQEDWRHPTLQERRAVLHAAKQALDDLTELIAALDPESSRR
jgi:hypothetical protein